MLTTSEILNEVKNIENYSYLELGLGNAINFDKIKCTDKVSVDLINAKATFSGLTDQFFEDNKRTFDIIFIDANHNYDFVLRDFNNSIKICNKIIICHDMIPFDVNYTKSQYCSDSYRILYYILKETNLKPIIWDEKDNMGMTIFIKPSEKLVIPDLYKYLSYQVFEKFIKRVKMYSKKEIIKYIEDNL